MDCVYLFYLKRAITMDAFSFESLFTVVGRLFLHTDVWWENVGQASFPFCMFQFNILKFLPPSALAEATRTLILRLIFSSKFEYYFSNQRERRHLWPLLHNQLKKPSLLIAIRSRSHIWPFCCQSFTVSVTLKISGIPFRSSSIQATLSQSLLSLEVKRYWPNATL